MTMTDRYDCSIDMIIGGIMILICLIAICGLFGIQALSWEHDVSTISIKDKYTTDKLWAISGDLQTYKILNKSDYAQLEIGKSYELKTSHNAFPPTAPEQWNIDSVIREVV